MAETRPSYIQYLDSKSLGSLSDGINYILVKTWKSHLLLEGVTSSWLVNTITFIIQWFTPNPCLTFIFIFPLCMPSVYILLSHTTLLNSKYFVCLFIWLSYVRVGNYFCHPYLFIYLFYFVIYLLLFSYVSRYMCMYLCLLCLLFLFQIPYSCKKKKGNVQYILLRCLRRLNKI